MTESTRGSLWFALAIVVAFVAAIWSYVEWRSAPPPPPDVPLPYSAPGAAK